MSLQIYGRLNILYNVLIYCSDQQKEGKIESFSLPERICINQERGALLSQLAFLNKEVFASEVRQSKVSKTIDSKIQLVIKKIEATNWGGFDQSRFLITDET